MSIGDFIQYVTSKSFNNLDIIGLLKLVIQITFYMLFHLIALIFVKHLYHQFLESIKSIINRSQLLCDK